MSLDLGSLIARADIITAPFDAKYARLMTRLNTIGSAAEKSSGGVRVLDRSFVGVASAADKVAISQERATKSTVASGSAAEKAAAAQRQHQLAVARVSTTMGVLAGATQREQAAVLRATAAQARYDEVLASGTATTKQLAGAQAGLIAAERSVTAAQEAAAVSGGRFRTSMAGTVKMAGELGLIVGAFEAVKKGIDLTKAANEYDRQMVQIETTTNTTAAEVTKGSAALLGISRDVAAGPRDLAVAWYHAKSVGLSYAQSLDTTKIAAEGAKVGHADLEETMNALTSTVASGIPGVEDMDSAMGKLIATVGAGDMKLSDLNQFLGSGILAVVKGYGLSLTDVGAAAATFGDNNIRGAEGATMLRMAVQAMAVPAKAGRDQLDALGLTANTLKKDMQEGGLNKAILDLKKHLDDAGISGVQVGGVLTEVFGKRAGPGLAVLIGQVDRLESKFAILEDSGSTFADKWAATKRTASFALDLLSAKAESAAITLTRKLGPSIATAANWLGTALPHDIAILASILGPTAHLVGFGLGGAFHLLAGVLGVVGGALGTIGHFLEQHRAIVTGVTTAVLAMWGAFKLIALAKVIIGGISIALRGFAASAFTARAALTGMATVGNVAMLGLGVAVAAATYIWQKHAAEVAANKAGIEAYSQALDADSQAIGKNVRALAEKNLVDEDAYQTALHLGISQKTLTDAVLGNAGALRTVHAAMAAAADGADKNKLYVVELSGALGENIGQLKEAVRNNKDVAAANGVSTDAVGRLSTATLAQTQFQKELGRADKETQIALDGTTYAMRGQSSAADILTAALARLSGDQNAVAESQLALKDALAGATDQVKQNGTALNANTKKGRSNLEWLHQQIDSINQVASAQIKNHASTQHVTDTLGANEQALRKAAIAAGFNAEMVDRLIKKYAATPKEIQTYIKAHTDEAATAALKLKAKLDDLAKQRTAIIKAGADPLALLHIRDQLDALTQPRVVPITVVTTHGTGSRLAQGRASGGGLPEGVSALGERGPELAIKSGPHVDILSNPQSKHFLRATGMSAPGFAGGTTSTTSASTSGTAVRSDFRTLGHLGLSLSSSRSDLANQLRQITKDLRAAGVPKSFLDNLVKDNKAILSAVASRNAAARHLAAANQALVNARQTKRQDFQSFRGAVTGSFDITSAGADAVTGRVTGGGIMAAQRQAVTRARLFVADLKKLIGKKVFPGSYIRQLAGKGPDALPEVQALLSLSPGELRTLAAENSELARLGRSIGGAAATRLDQPAIDRARHEQHLWREREKRREAHLERELGKLANHVSSTLDDLHLTGKLGLTAGQLYLLVETGKKQSRPRGSAG